MAAIAPMKTMPLRRDSQQLLLLIEQVVRYFLRYHKYTLGTELRQQAMRISGLLPLLREQHIAYCLILEEGYLKQRLLYIRIILSARFTKKSTRGYSMLIKHCFVLLFTLAATNMAAAACNNAIPKTTPDNAFTLHNNGTVTLNKTGLMWMRCELGKTWDVSTCSGSSQAYKWSAALQAAEGYAFAGYSDWRVPNKNELASIVEWACVNPAINTTAFSDFPASNVWSSSPHAPFFTGDAWFVGFGEAGVAVTDKLEGLHVRLVRGGQ